jgi:hypothetical protein
MTDCSGWSCGLDWTVYDGRKKALKLHFLYHHGSMGAWSIGSWEHRTREHWDGSIRRLSGSIFAKQFFNPLCLLLGHLGLFSSRHLEYLSRESRRLVLSHGNDQPCDRGRPTAFEACTASTGSRRCGPAAALFAVLMDLFEGFLTHHSGRSSTCPPRSYQRCWPSSLIASVLDQ